MFSLQDILISVPAILLALSFHEFSHGFVAYKLGDPTPEQQGRLTLNPLAHLDPIGTLLLLVAQFGWAKPVMVNPMNFRGNKKNGMLLVALAGPVSNMIFAIIAGLILNQLIKNIPDLNIFWGRLLFYLVLININLAIFNLIPVPPLDGSKILAGLLPYNMYGIIFKLETYGSIILLLLVVTNVINKIIDPVSTFMLKIILPNFF
jgi:Zn-dependent protease